MTPGSARICLPNLVAPPGRGAFQVPTKGISSGRCGRLAAMAIERVFVAGAGLMGHGIAQVHAAIGKRVDLYEPDVSRAAAGRDRIAGNLESAVAKGRLDGGARDATVALVRPTADLGAAANADLVIEAVFEDLDVKRGLWAELDRVAPDRAIFASNTSSISIDLLAQAVSQRRRARFVGM